VTTSQAIQKATRILDRGGVIAYPTEGVFGLGCLPDNVEAVSRVLDIKQRDPAMGLVLIAAHVEQLNDWINLPLNDRDLTSDSDRTVTWIVPAASDVPAWIRGSHTGIAVRVTTHPVARALCEAAESALVSTSANISGRPPARNAFVLRRNLGSLVDYIVPGQCGSASGPSEIRVFGSGEIVRPA
jgi:L-threonylcarbamoyladenylate synthase